MKQPHSIR